MKIAQSYRECDFFFRRHQGGPKIDHLENARLIKRRSKREMTPLEDPKSEKVKGDGVVERRPRVYLTLPRSPRRMLKMPARSRGRKRRDVYDSVMRCVRLHRSPFHRASQKCNLRGGLYG